MPARKPRSDGQRNRAQLVSRTAELFYRRGTEVPMEEIAEHAGVGVGTLYRHFPDRAALTGAVARSLYEQIDGLVEHVAAESPGPWEALNAVIRGWVDLRLAVRKPLDRWLVEERQASPQLRERHDRIVGFLDRNVAAAQAAGTLRPDVTRNDIIRLIGLLVLDDQAGHLTDIVIDGLRAASERRP